MQHQTVDRIILQHDGHPIVRYWTPREYIVKHPYMELTKINESVDVLNGELYAKALALCKTEDVVDVKAPHIYGVFQV